MAMAQASILIVDSKAGAVTHRFQPLPLPMRRRMNLSTGQPGRSGPPLKEPGPRQPPREEPPADIPPQEEPPAEIPL